MESHNLNNMQTIPYRSHFSHQLSDFYIKQSRRN